MASGWNATVCSCYAILSESIKRANGACCLYQMVPAKACLKSLCRKRFVRTIMCYPIAGEPTHRVKVGGKPSQFKSLHGRKIEIIGKCQANPSLRSLFLKADMAHGVDRMLPHPATRLEAYQIKCGKMNQPNWTIWQKSVPDRSLPVVQEVHDQQIRDVCSF